MVSIIIPTLNEEDNIGKLVHYLRQESVDTVQEIIVVDGGSRDDTINCARNAGANALVSPQKGRAAQMNYGASMSLGDNLFFIHADTIPPPTFATDIEQACKVGFSLGRYRSRFDSNSILLKFNAYFTRFDLFMCYGGDQSLFITKELFDNIGGFNNEMIIMEDYELVERARGKGRYKIFDASILISARKYEMNNWWKVQRANYLAVKMYRKGLPQMKIVNAYKKNLDYR
ncbi:MAG: TIGR04283 family arsenosugar biosynthesis glycosyltransferase [Ginsengibacter sp.]